MSRSRVCRGLRLDQGSSVVGWILLVPVLVIAIELVVVGGRAAVITLDVSSAAREAARQASLASGQTAAKGLIGGVAEVSLESRGVECQDLTVTLDGAETDFVAGGQVQVSVRCTVNVADVGWFPITPNATFDVTRHAAEPIDRFRVVEP